MKFSSRIESCSLSPIRKFHPYMMEAKAKGRTVYHLNIGQPDIETPKNFLMPCRITRKRFWPMHPLPV